MKIANHDIGVCSWSLRPRSSQQLIALLREMGLEHVQVALGWLLGMDEATRQRTIGELRDAGLRLTAGMTGFAGEDYSTIATIHKTGGYVPDGQWPARKQATLAAGRLAAEMQLPMMSAHIGFVPPSSHESYKVLVERVGEVAERLGEMNVELLMETGQEQAPALLQFLNDVAPRPVFVNFDPANMVLYGAGDPVEAVKILGRHIRHVHVKDATPSAQPGTLWGQEVPFGAGQVGAARFLRALREVGYVGALAIEREVGEDPVADIRFAVQTLAQAATEVDRGTSTDMHG